MERLTELDKMLGVNGGEQGPALWLGVEAPGHWPVLIDGKRVMVLIETQGGAEKRAAELGRIYKSNRFSVGDHSLASGEGYVTADEYECQHEISDFVAVER